LGAVFVLVRRLALPLPLLLLDEQKETTGKSASLERISSSSSVVVSIYVKRRVSRATLSV
jgi:hypothetical protein